MTFVIVFCDLDQLYNVTLNLIKVNILVYQLVTSMQKAPLMNSVMSG
jgi:hypothetical protein